MLNLIWIDPNLDTPENQEYAKQLIAINSLKFKSFKTVDEAITYMMDIKFEETQILVTGRLYVELVENFKQNIKEMCITPKIIVFTRNANNFLKYNVDYKNKNNSFYNSGGILTDIKVVKNFLTLDIKKIKQIKQNNLINQINEKKIHGLDDVQLIFEYIDNKEKLILPLFYKTLIERSPKDNFEKYNNILYNTYSKQNNEFTELLNSIISRTNIPLEILSKYYARLYTIDSNFHKDMNKDLKKIK